MEKSTLKSGIPSQHQNKGTASRDSGHDAPLSTLWGTGGAARAAVPAYFPSASEYAYRQVCSPRESSLIADADRMPVMVLAMRSHLFQRSSAVNLSVTGDIEMISYVREAPVADVVPAASLKIQPPPLRGGGAVDNNQGDGSHDHQIQAFRPSAPATAVATVIITFRISVQVFFFVLELIGILF